MANGKLIALEFNELCPELLERWMAEGELPNFARFHSASQVFTAVADEPGPDNLEPWIQWYSMHTGLAYSQHGVRNLADGPLAPHTGVWQLLARHGLKVANCSSMNASAVRAPGALFVPDPWCVNETPYPDDWASYHRVVAGLVQENSTASVGGLGGRDYLRFASFLATHGLRMRTLRNLAAQVMSDTLMRQPTRWKRAALLDQIQFDVFRRHWLNARPDYSSFFLNSTAHFQHAFWHCAFPEQFPEAPSPSDQERFGSAILYGYKQMDRLLGDLFEPERHGAVLVLCTALSQQGRGRSDLVYYRPRDAGALLHACGLVPEEILPVMGEQFNVRFRDPATATSAMATLGSLNVDGTPMLNFGLADPNTVFFGIALRSAVPDGAPVGGLPGARTVRFGDLAYRLPTTKATVHHPESLIWFKTGRHVVHPRKVSILDWLPTVLEWYALDPRNVPGPPRSGTSFLSSMGV
jgi:hypothetical protein